MKRRDDDIAAHAENSFFSAGKVLQERMPRWTTWFACAVILMTLPTLIQRPFNIHFLRRSTSCFAVRSAVTNFSSISSGISFFFFVSQYAAKQRNAATFRLLKKNQVNWYL
jgi:hypothetical protein